MKKMALLFALLLGSISYSQEFNPVKMELKGRIEIDGHVHYAKSAVNKFYWEADLSGMKIIDSKKMEYVNRKCTVNKCPTIHLVKKQSGIIYQTENIFGVVPTLKMN